MSNDAKRTEFVALVGDSLVLDLMDRIPDLPESVGSRVLDIATDPLAPRIGTELVPVEGIDEDDIDHPVIDDLPVEYLGDLDLADTPESEIRRRHDRSRIPIVRPAEILPASLHLHPCRSEIDDHFVQ